MTSSSLAPSRDSDRTRSPFVNQGPPVQAVALAADEGGSERKAVDVIPVRIDDEGLTIQTRNGEKRIPYASIDKMALAMIRGSEFSPFLLLDLMLKGKPGRERILRLSTLSFNPMKLVPNPGSPKDALLQMVKILKHFSGAEAVPNEDALAGHPFSVFDSIAAYEASLPS